jgi:hypothetical protein
MSLLEGNYTEAIICLLKSIELSYELGHRQIIASALGSLGFAIGLCGEPDAVSASLQAAQLFGAAASLQGAIGYTPWTLAIPAALEAYQQIRARVDKQSWKEASVAGRALSEEQAIALAYRLLALQGIRFKTRE